MRREVRSRITLMDFFVALLAVYFIYRLSSTRLQ
jgi:hypothetical protein